MILMPESWYKRLERQRQEECKIRLTQTVAWTDKLVWKPQLTIAGNTWPLWNLFDVMPTEYLDINLEKDTSCFAQSPSGKFAYCRKILPRGTIVNNYCGSRPGTVLFDRDMPIDTLHETHGAGKRWDTDPWMSITPQELMTHRPGIRMAKGHTVVAGLGLGWLLVQVLQKKTVKKATLVEISPELVDWLLPVILPLAGEHAAKLEVVVGDAYDVLPPMTADVALVDIYQGYGGNDFLDELHWRRKGNPATCPGIRKLWNWGKAAVKERGYY